MSRAVYTCRSYRPDPPASLRDWNTQPEPAPSRHPDVAAFPTWFWLVLALACFAAVVALLHLTAARVREQVEVHDLRIRVIDMRNKYVRQIRALRGDGDPDDFDDAYASVEILDD